MSLPIRHCFLSLQYHSARSTLVTCAAAVAWHVCQVAAVLTVLLQPPSNNWNIRSPSATGDSPAPDDWEIDISQLHIDSKVAAGSFSNLYRGYYCGQEVAVKILKEMQDDASQYQEFLQEVSIMRKVRAK